MGHKAEVKGTEPGEGEITIAVGKSPCGTFVYHDLSFDQYNKVIPALFGLEGNGMI